MDYKKAETLLETLAPACEKALNAHVRQLSGDALDDAAAAALREHRESCAVCRELLGAMDFSDQALRGHRSQPSAGFAARTLAALPATIESAPDAETAPALRVFSGGAPIGARAKWSARKWTRWVGIAAALALLAGAGIWMAMAFARPAQALTIQSGSLEDSHGRTVKTIPLNTAVTARDNTVLRGKHNELMNIRKGAQFMVSAGENQEPELQLASGDVYAAAVADSLRFECPHFQAELDTGDCFVAHEASAVPRSVMILFEGSARVTAHRHDAAALRSGQVFVCVGDVDEAYTDTLNLNDVVKALEQPAPGPLPARARDPAAVKRQYEKLVQDYRTELADIDRRAAAGGNENASDAAELRERSVRVTRYLQAHEARLRAMTGGGGIDRSRIPVEEIKRGLDGRTDPSTWL